MIPTVSTTGEPGVLAAGQAPLEQLLGEIAAARSERGTKSSRRTSTGRGGSGGTASASDGSAGVSDAEIIDKICTGKSGRFAPLWTGEHPGYPSRSEAEFALLDEIAYLVGPDAGRIDSIYRQSGLCNEKWDRLGPATIAKILAGKTKFHEWPSNGSPKPPGRPGRRVRDPNRGQFQFTDLGNAERFAQYYADYVKYAADRNVWLVFDGQRWAEDRSQVRVESLAKEMLHLWATGAAAVVGEAAKELANAEGKEEKEAAKSAQKDAQAELDFALQSQDRRAIGRMLHLARSEPGIVVHNYGDRFDRDNWLLNTSTGTVDLRTGELHPHNREHFITKITPVGYDPAARSPRFLRFLDAVFGGDSDLVAYVLRVLGYALTGDTSNHVVHVFYGGGSNGKSVLVEVLKHVWGEYGGKIESTVLVNDGRDRHPTERASLAGLRFAFASETEEGRKLDAARIKELSGGDTITARKMRQDFFEFPPTHKLFLCTNHKPRVPGTDHGIWRRLRLILFGVMFWTEADRQKNPEATFGPSLKADPTLTATLLAEASGILAMLVQEAVKYHADRVLTPPDAVVKATGEYQKGEDTIGQFFDERVIPDPNGTVGAVDFYAAYKAWGDALGCKIAGSRTFGENAKKRFEYIVPKSTYYRVKICVVNPSENSDDQTTGGAVGPGVPPDKRSPARAYPATHTVPPPDPRHTRRNECANEVAPPPAATATGDQDFLEKHGGICP